MPLSTRCVLLCPALGSPDPGTAQRLLRAIGLSHVRRAWLYPDESHEYRPATDEPFVDEDDEGFDDDEDDFVEAEDLDLFAAAELVSRAPTVTLFPFACTLQYAANAQSRSLIDESIRGYCIVTGMTIELGPHDVFGNRGDDVLTHVGRPNFSVTLSSGGLPNDLAAYRRAFEALPCIVDTRRALEQIAGRVDLEIFLSF